MKRALSFLLLLTFGACATAPASKPHHLMAATAYQSRIDTNQVQFHKGTPPAPDSDALAIITTDGVTLLQQNPNGTTSTLGGGGGTVTSVTGSAPIASSGGTTPNITIAASTTSVPGYMSAAQATQLSDNALVNQWARDRAHEASGYVPSATRCVYPGKMGWAPFAGGGALSTVACGTEMGCWSTLGGGVNFVSGSITAVPKTGVWFLAVRAKFATPTSGQTRSVALASSGFTHDVSVNGNFATDTTHFNLHTGSTSVVSTQVISNSTWYNITLWGDGTNVKARINDVDVGMTTAQSNVSADEAMGFTLFNTTQGDVIVSDVMFCGP